MKKIILLIAFCSVFLLACKSGGESENTLTNNDKEKALLQREKDLLERENASLKNKQENSKLEVRQEQQQVEQKQQYSEPKSNFRKSLFRAKSERVYFYNNGHYNSRNASFIVEGQTPIALSIDGEFVYVTFTYNGITTNGYMLLSELEFVSYLD